MILPDVEGVLFYARTFRTAGVMSPSPIPIMTAAIVIVTYDGSRMKNGTQKPMNRNPTVIITVSLTL